MPSEFRKLVVTPIIDNNPITLQILGICSALAVTTKLAPAIIMSIALTLVLIGSNVIISLIRNHMPNSIRIIIQMTIIASLVIVVDQILKAYAYELSRQLSVFVGLIITNCIVMGRCEVFASRNGPLAAVADGAANAVGYALVLCAVALVREPLGSGTLLGWRVMPAAYDPCQLMALAPGAFLAMGVLVWIVRAKWPAEEAAQGRP